MSSMVIKVAGVPLEVVDPTGSSFVQRVLSPYVTSEEPLFEVKPKKSYGDWLSSVLPEWDDELVFQYQLMHHIAVGLLDYECLLLHAAVVEVDGVAYAFAAPSGTGKSTHVSLWKRHFGERAHIVNGDKPFLRRLDGTWYACASPWAGKENWQTREDVPLAALCFIERGDVNAIRPVGEKEEMDRLIFQLDSPEDPDKTDTWLGLVGRLIEEVPCSLLTCTISDEAVRLAYQTLSGENAGKASAEFDRFECKPSKAKVK